VLGGVFLFLGLTLRAADPASPPQDRAADDSVTASAAAVPPAAPSIEELRHWIAALASDEFDTRESATRDLGHSGQSAVPFLSEAAQGPSLEVTCRAIRALESIADHGNEAAFEAAQAALEQLSESKSRSVVRRASVALQSLGPIRRKHAIARIIELGGIVKPVTLPRGILMPDDEDDNLIGQVIINRRWKGGDEGLIHLRRLGEFQHLFVTDAAHVSDKALDALKQEFPNRMIERRGNAMLGIRGGRESPYCQIADVTTGSAAEKAGLEPGDVIIKYDGEEVRNFPRLVELTNSHDVGDTIQLEINRMGKVLKKDLVLGEFK
jgi:hypothetical protein